MFCQRKSNSTDTFLLDEWSEESNTTKSGPSSDQQQNAGGNYPIWNAGLVAFNFPGDLESPKGFQFSREGARTLCHPSLDPRILILVECADINEKLSSWMLRTR